VVIQWLHSGYTVVTVVIQWLHSGYTVVTVVIQRLYSGYTVVTVFTVIAMATVHVYNSGYSG